MKKRIAAQYRRLIRKRDRVLGQPIVYMRYTGTAAGRPALGIPNVRQYTDTPFMLQVKELDAEEVATSGGILHMGDIQIDVRLDTVSYDDRIRIGSRWFRPVQITEIHVAAPQGWKIYAREDPDHGQ